jgi:hypothetical protein
MNQTTPKSPAAVASHTAAAVKCQPILFSTAMVQAILNGHKTQTRRIIKFPADFDGQQVYNNAPFGLKYTSNEFEGCVHRLYCKYQPGNVLWVRETWQQRSEASIKIGFDKYYYRATHEGCTDAGWRPSIFMPKQACRLFLKVESICPQKLQDISEADAEQEGLPTPPEMKGRLYDGQPYACHNFKKLWASINGLQSWNNNPWVWVVKFQITAKPQNFL